MSEGNEQGSVLGKHGHEGSSFAGSTSSDIHRFYREMRDKDKLIDVVFIVEDKRFRAHRFILEARSKNLDALLFNGMKETKQREIELHEVQADVWRVVLDLSTVLI